MFYERPLWITCFLKLSCARSPASHLPASCGSVSARLTNAYRSSGVVYLSGVFSYGSARSVNWSGLWAPAHDISLLSPLNLHAPEKSIASNSYYISFCHRHAPLLNTSPICNTSCNFCASAQAALKVCLGPLLFRLLQFPPFPPLLAALQQDRRWASFSPAWPASAKRGGFFPYVLVTRGRL